MTYKTKRLYFLLYAVGLGIVLQVLVAVACFQGRDTDLSAPRYFYSFIIPSCSLSPPFFLLLVQNQSLRRVHVHQYKSFQSMLQNKSIKSTGLKLNVRIVYEIMASKLEERSHFKHRHK